MKVNGVARGLVLSLLITGCIVKRFNSPRLTGTCSGACAHYVSCKPGHSDADGARCNAECPDVFSDADSIMAYESLSCRDAVEYIDGNASKTATP